MKLNTFYFKPNANSSVYISQKISVKHSVHDTDISDKPEKYSAGQDNLHGLKLTKQKIVQEQLHMYMYTTN